MSSVIEDREFKQIKYVWILNLIPPASGIGLLYGCGPISFILVFFSWCYLATHFNLEAIFDVYMVFSILGTIGCVFHNLSLNNVSLIEKECSETIPPGPIEILADFDFSSQEEESLEQKGNDGLSEGISFFEKCEEQKLGANENTSFQIEQSDHTLNSPHMISLESNFDRLIRIASDNPNNLDESDDIESSDKTNDPVNSRVDSGDAIEKETSNPDPSSLVEPEDARPQGEDEADISVNNSSSQENYVAKDSSTNSKGLDKFENNELSGNLVDAKGEPNFVEQRKGLLKKLGAATGEFQLETNGYEKFENSESSFDPSTFDFNLPTSFESNFACMQATKDSGRVETEKSVTHCDCGSEVNTSFSFCLTCGKIFS